MRTKFPELFLRQSVAIAVAVLALLTVSSHAATALTITTWNLEHMMSEKTFDEWSAFCAKYDWDEDKVKAAGASASKPKHLTYCNAHNGLLYPTTVPELLALHSRDAFAKKVATLVKRRAELNSDVFVLQEVENESAVRRIFPESDWNVIVTKADIPQNIGYAVRKNGRAKVVGSKQIDQLAQVDDTGHRVRPGLELKIEVDGKQLVLLNVHLKASCRSQPISAPTRPGYADDRRWEEIQQGCKVMRKQVPQLEAWVEAQTRKQAMYMIVGDWNRDLRRDLQLPARLAPGESAKSPITESTQIGSLLKEISDDEPKGAWLGIVKTDISALRKAMKARDQRGYDKVCHDSIDNFALSDALLKAFGADKDTLTASGADYGADAYGVDKARRPIIAR